jgi:kinesin family protein 4/21/27
MQVPAPKTVHMLPLPWLLQDPLNAGRNSGTETASARSLAVAYSTLSKVLAALRNTSAGAGSLGQAANASLTNVAGQQQQQQQLQHLPWRDSPLTRWLQEQLHAANAILLLGTISTDVEVGGWVVCCCSDSNTVGNARRAHGLLDLPTPVHASVQQ